MSTENVVTSISVAPNAMPRSAQILRRIKGQMGEQEMTKQELGERSGIHRVTIGRALSGQRPFTIDELECIAYALEVGFDWLITGVGSPTPPDVPPAGIEPAAFCSGGRRSIP